MLATLQQLPAIVWGIAILVLILASALGIWLHRRFELKKIKLKTAVMEAELERRPGEKPASAASPTAAAPQPTANINIRGNKLWGWNIFRIRRQGTNVEDTVAVGKNVIEVGDKPGPKPKKQGRKPAR